VQDVAAFYTQGWLEESMPTGHPADDVRRALCNRPGPRQRAGHARRHLWRHQV